jgi:hypothetical protein
VAFGLAPSTGISRTGQEDPQDLVLAIDEAVRDQDPVTLVSNHSLSGVPCDSPAVRRVLALDGDRVASASLGPCGPFVRFRRSEASEVFNI